MRYGVLFVSFATLVAACGGSSDPGPPTAAPFGSAAHNDTGDAQPETISGEPASADEAGSWYRFNLEGVFVEIPTGEDWAVQFQTDPCSSRLEKFILVEHRKTLERIKVDLATKTVHGTGFGDAGRLDAVISRIQRSFSGTRQLSEILERQLPLPTTTACDPKAIDDVPTLTPEFFAPAVEPATVAPGPTITPVTPPAPPSAPAR